MQNEIGVPVFAGTPILFIGYMTLTDDLAAALDEDAVSCALYAASLEVVEGLCGGSGHDGSNAVGVAHLQLCVDDVATVGDDALRGAAAGLNAVPVYLEAHVVEANGSGSLEGGEGDAIVRNGVAAAA